MNLLDYCAYETQITTSSKESNWVGKIPWRRAWQPTPVSCLKNAMDRGAWQAIVHGVTQLDMTEATKSAATAAKNLPANAGDIGLIPGMRTSPGEENGNPLQYSCLENSLDRGAWWAVVHGVAKESDTT